MNPKGKRPPHSPRHIFYACFEDLTREAAWTIHIREVVNGWEKLGMSVTLFAPKVYPFGVAPKATVVYVPTIDVRYLREYVYLLILPFFILWHGVGSRPEAIYCREMSLVAPIVCVARLLGAPVIMEINGYVLEEMRLAGAHPLKRSVFRLLQLVSLALADALVFVSPSLRETFLGAYALNPNKTHVVPNGVDTDAFCPGDRADAVGALGLDPQKRYITFVGSFYPHAETPLIVRSAAVVLKGRAEARFLMIGDGHERPACERSARDLSISSGLFFLGSRPHGEIPAYIRASDLLINVRRFYEEGSMKMLEYMSCGGAVISNFRCLYGVSLSHGRDYFRLDDPSPEGLARAIITLLDDQALKRRIRKRARALILENFSWEKTAERLLEVIDEVRENR